MRGLQGLKHSSSSDEPPIMLLVPVVGEDCDGKRTTPLSPAADGVFGVNVTEDCEGRSTIPSSSGVIARVFISSFVGHTPSFPRRPSSTSAAVSVDVRFMRLSTALLPAAEVDERWVLLPGLVEAPLRF